MKDSNHKITTTLFITDENPLIVKNGITAANNSLLRSFKQIPVNIYIYREEKFLIYNNGKVSTLNHDLLDLNIFNNIIFGSLILTDKFKINQNINKSVQLSDCYTHALYMNIRLSIKFGWLDWKSLVKLPVYFFRERKVAKLMQQLIMQTPRDVAILKKWKISSKGIPIPNVPILPTKLNKPLFKLEPNIGWCATFMGSYLKIAKWFFDTILFSYLKKHQGIKLNIIGAGSQNFVNWIINKDENLRSQIVDHDYLENLNSFYVSNRVNISPVYKGYGLINKSVEAMACKSLVLGDVTAFNGLKVNHKESVLIVNNDMQWHELLDYVFFTMQEQEYLKITENAQKIVVAQLSLSTNNEVLKSILI
jgi:hypothetical protein